ncbi:MAG: T9SS type A sorting domain-containing protein [Sphingobacteriales bacterium]|nr:MAG: T9SS type A sorting domain-containing protein [Sphingobacteriales bacterium]
MKKLLLLAFFLVCYSHSFAYLSQGHWRWRNNDGTEKGATWKTGQDTAIVINDTKAIRLRINVTNGWNSVKYYGSGLEYTVNPKGPWIPLSSATANNAFVLAGNNAYLTDNTLTTKQIVDTVKTFAPGKLITMSANHSDSLLVDQRKEYEWIIKPTVNILPDTKYYFRAALGGEQVSNLPSLTTGSGFAVPQTLLSNGSFEQGLNGWANTDANDGSTFAIQDTAIYEGNKALRVVVKTPGAAGSGAVQTVHAPFATSSARTYMVRFWAKAGADAAGLTLAIQGASGTKTCKFRLTKTMDEYQFAFKITDPQTAIRFYYDKNTSYVLDKVSVFDDNDPLIDVAMHYMWQNNRSGYGWLTTDAQKSVGMPDGRTAWIFSDTWMGINDPTNNFTNTSLLLNNVMVIQSAKEPNGTLTTYYGGTQADPKAFMLPVTPKGIQYFYWPRDPIIEKDNIKVLLAEVYVEKSGAPIAFAGIMSVATISQSTLKVTKIEDLPFIKEQWETLLAGDANAPYNYVYGGAIRGIARYPKDQLSASVPWEFYTAGGTWVKDAAQATNIVDVDFASVVQLGPDNYAGVYMTPVSNSIEVVYAKSPVGPWTNRTQLYFIPPFTGGFAYMPFVHKETGKDGVFTISYSVGTSIPAMLNDKGTYQPRYIKANLGALSPYAVAPPVTTVTGYGATSAGKNVTLDFTTLKADDTGYEVQSSTDGSSWKTIATTAGSNSTKHQAVFKNPHNGPNYYRIVTYDIDKKRYASAKIFSQVKENAAVTTFTANGKSNRVDFAINTSSEFCNRRFVIARSADGQTGWAQLIEVAGSGTVSSAKSYAVSDNNPLPGKNYYRLVYYLNGVITYSTIRVVDMAPAAATAFSVYPNPVSADVSFGLKDYTGKQVTATLTDLFGKVITTETLNINAQQHYTLKVRPAQRGTYILNVSGEGLRETAKVLVQ